MIELTCPNCKSSLEVDEGFKGGVCRCFNCGTLMTVPDDPVQERAETLTESAAPSPSQRPTGKPASKPPPTYTTKSGKTMRLSAQQVKKAPVARQPRKSVRVAVMSTAITISVLAIGGVVALGFYLFRSPPAAVPVNPYENLNDIENNPFTWTEPNFMGLPVGSSTVMVIDASASMRDQIGWAKRAALRSIPTLGERKAQVIFWLERKPYAYPAEPTPASKIDLAGMEAALEEVSPGGAGNPASAIAQALATQPEQVTILARSLPDAGTITAQIKSSGARLVVVHIDGDAEDPANHGWKDTATATKGLYATVSSARIRRWHEEYLDKAQNADDKVEEPATGGKP